MKASETTLNGHQSTMAKALALSFLFHAGALFFHYTLKMWPESPQPFFVFLGSILHKQDFLLRPTYGSNQRLDMVRDPGPVADLSNPELSSPEAARKPAPIFPPPYRNKKILKSTFPEDHVSESSENKVNPEAELNPPPRYRPIRDFIK